MMVFDERDPGCFVTIDEATYFFDTKEEFDEFMRIKKIKKLKNEIHLRRNK